MHRCRWVGRACAAVVLVLPVVLVGLTASVDDSAAAAEGPRLTPKLSSITSSVTAKTKTIGAKGSVANTGDSTVTDVKASFWIAPRAITTRAELSAISRADLGAVGGERVTRTESLIDDVSRSLKPGAKASFDVRVPTSELIEQYGVDRPGIYLVGIDIRGAVDGERETWRVRTFLPWMVTTGASGTETPKPADVPLRPIEVAYVLPIAAPSELVSEGYLLDEKSTEVLAPDGRLSRLLDLGAKHDLSFLVDPAVLELANVVQDGYRIVGDDPDDRERRTGQTQALQFYEKARGLLAAHDAMMLPYADPDLPALQRNEMTEPYAGAVSRAKRDASYFKTNGSVVAWPGNGHASSDMLDTVEESGGNTVLLRQDALPDVATDGSSPVVSMTVSGGNLNGLVADPTLTASGPANDRSTLQMRQRFLSETALLALRPGSTGELRRVVAAFDRAWDPGAAGDAFFDAASSTPWLRQISVGSLLTQPPTAYGGTPYYPASGARAELGTDVIGLLGDLSEQSTTYVDLLATKADRGIASAEQRRAFLRGASTSWRTRQDRDEHLVSTMYSKVLDDNTKGTGIVQLRTITMPAGEGRFPVTIANHLRKPVRVQLVVTPRGEAAARRVKIQPIKPQVVGPDRKATISVQAEGAPGTVTLRAQLHTVTTDSVVGPVNTTFQVNIKNFAPVGWAIIGAGMGLLLLAVVFRLVRRLRGDRGEAEEKAAEKAEDEKAGDPVDREAGDMADGESGDGREPA